MLSPYVGLDTTHWKSKTLQLIEQYPLSLEEIKNAALKTWQILWQTKIGTGKSAISLDEIDVPATVIGYFFEKLYARELEIRYPNQWRGGRSKGEKDLVCLINPFFSTEIKSSGQLGTKIYGNRSYKQETRDDSLISKEEKSGYYITVNFYGTTITLLRLGWIDFEDWQPQKAATGQAATLKGEVYQHKLIEITGEYRLNAPVGLLEGIGKKRIKIFASEGIKTMRDLLDYEGNNEFIQRFKDKVKNLETT
ncbi:ScaI family restriction endonuclease [Candidatus Poribacteria bacterium]|nr:ScaI family restriction endonuclease [Candidatus Poribacteria bacterium]